MGQSIPAWERYITIGVDDYGDKNPAGCLWFGERKEGLRFTGLMQLFLAIESLLRDAAYTGGGCPVGAPGKLGTFRIKILFRQHESWQGTLSWIEGRREKPFRSALELALMLDGALSGIESLDYGNII